MRKRPNIFDYATSELSQDAFLTWLIQWADNDFQKIDSPLNSCAVEFVRNLLEVDNTFFIETIETGRQWKNIDVWALVNNKYFIVIEDKKETKEHSDQLTRYAKIAREHYEHTDIQVKLIYFKMEDQGKYQAVKDAGFSVFKRSKMLSILEYYINTTVVEQQNDIIVDYHNNLKSLDEATNSFLTSKLEDWQWHSWQGFYSYLQQNLGGTWDYVPNAAGGFLGFFWNWKDSNIEGKAFQYYIQLEQHKLIFKLYVCDENDRREIRAFYRKHLYAKAKELNIEISQFGRIGAYMGVAKLNTEYRIVNQEGLLDLSATVENLKRITNLINETAKQVNSCISLTL